MARQKFPEGLKRRVGELSVLYALTDGLYRAQTHQDMLDAALDAIATALGTRASILLFDPEGVMRFVAWRGLSARYREKLEGHSPWRLGDRNAEPIYVEDIDQTTEPDWIKAEIRAELIRGLAFIPIISEGAVIGKFMTYYSDCHEFDPREKILAVTIARQLGFALERARAEKARRLAEGELRESEQRFRLMSEQAPVMIWMSGADGSCMHLNRALRDFWAVAIEEVATFDWRATMHPEDADTIGRAMMEATSNQVPVTIEGRYRNASGEYRLLKTEARPRFSADGSFLGMIGVNIDITERNKAEVALRESENRLKVALAAGRMGTWQYDLATGAQTWDQRQFELFGLDPSLPASRELFLSRVHPDDLGLIAFDDQAIAAPDRFLDSQFRIIKPGGEVRWINAHSVTRHDEDGIPVDMVGVNFDITPQKETEEHLRLLVDELNHRVKNTLAIVQGIAHQTFRGGMASEASRSAFTGRLVALASAHTLLTRTNWEAAPLSRLAADTLAAQGVDGARVQIGGPPIQLPSRQALALALALHELGTNAVKYGALSNESGRVSLDWALIGREAQQLKITWRESGGPPVLPPTRKGFGSTLIERALSRDIDAYVLMDFAPGGLVCTVEAPLPGGSHRS